MVIVLSLYEAERLLEMFGGDDTLIAVEKVEDEDGEAHSGPGIYAYAFDYPDEGSIKLDDY